MERDVSDGRQGSSPVEGAVEVERPTEEMRELFGLAFAGAERFAEFCSVGNGRLQVCKFFFKCRNTGERFAFVVVDDLHRQIFIAPRHRHAGTGSRSVDRFADMEFSVQTASVFIVHLFNHNTSPYFTPVLPTLRLMTSVS